MSQNLIRNGDFEDFISCPTDMSQLDSCLRWYSPSGGSTDFYHRCAGSGPCATCVPNCLNVGPQEAQSGDGMIGMFVLWPNAPGYREYAQSELIQPLTMGEKYEFAMYVNFSEYSNQVTDPPQVYFSSTPLTGIGTGGFFLQNPQIVFDTLIADRDDWTLLKGCLVAEGGERYLTIGNFREDADTRSTQISGGMSPNIYFFLDNISLQSLDTVDVQMLPEEATLCEGDSLVIDLVAGYEYVWNDGFSGVHRRMDSAGLYWVERRSDCGVIRDSVEVMVEKIPFLELGEGGSLCPGDTLEVHVHTNMDVVVWWDGPRTDSIRYFTQPGVYWAGVVNGCGSEVDSFVIRYSSPLPEIEISDTVICDGETIIVEVPDSFDVQWSTGSTERTFMISMGGEYSVRVYNSCEEEVLDTFFVAERRSPTVDLGRDTSFCNRTSWILEYMDSSTTWMWSDGSTNPQWVVDHSGEYSIIARNSCGETRDTVHIDFLEDPLLEVPDTVWILCGQNGAWVEAISKNGSIVWSDGSRASSFFVEDVGLLEVGSENACGQVSKEVQVVQGVCGCDVFVPNVFSPNGDNINDNVSAFFGCDVSEFDFLIFDRWGELIYASKEGADASWDGTFEGRVLPTGVYAYLVIYDFSGSTFHKSGSITLLK